MYKEIQTEVNYLSDSFFTGIVRFGIEHGMITSMYSSTKAESISCNNQDVYKEIRKLYPEEKEFYGNVEFVFNFGKVISSNYNVVLQGEQLREKLRKHAGKEVLQCKNVNDVAKK